MLKQILALVVSFFLLGGCGPGQAQEPIVELSEAVVIDVRTNEEWQAGHLADVKLIPWETIVLETDKLNLDKNQAIAVFCRSGNRAGKAMALLNEAGYTHVINLGSLEQAASALNQDIVK
jgi:phage shock protein E